LASIRPRKRFGQHFLVDERILTDILSAAELNPVDTIVEVGPGLGILTKELAKRAARVIAVEIDARLVSILGKKISSFGNVRIVHGDILRMPPAQLLEIAQSVPHNVEEDLEVCPSPRKNYKVVANLPYYITSPVLRHFLEASAKPSLMVVMVQREVGEAIVAAAGRMSLLSLRIQFYSKPTIIAYVPPESFSPPPSVDSVILRLDVYPNPPVEVSDVASFFDIITDGFSSPRKQLRNSLAQALGMPPKQVAPLLEKAGVEARRRAESLNLEEWKRLWEIFARLLEAKNADYSRTSQSESCSGSLGQI